MESAPRSDAPPATPPEERAARPVFWWYGSMLALLIAAAALVFAAWQWYDARNWTDSLRQDVTDRLAAADSQTRESRTVAAQGRETMAELRSQLGALEQRLAESQKQQAALDALYQELSRNREEWALAEIEQSLLVASQHLQLGGNARAALIALQAADARLQRMERPQLLALRKAIHRDIDRLKAAPQVDTVAVSVRLESILARVDGLPLAMDARPRTERPAASGAGADGDVWTRFWRETWSEMKQLIRVQQADQPDSTLLAPSQAYFLRENLKLRLIGARVALLARDGASYKADLSAAHNALVRYYDTRHQAVAHSLATLRSLQEADPGMEPPDIGSTLEAMRSLRMGSERRRP